MKKSFEPYNVLGGKSYELNLLPPSTRYVTQFLSLGQQVHLPQQSAIAALTRYVNKLF